MRFFLLFLSFICSFAYSQNIQDLVKNVKSQKIEIKNPNNQVVASYSFENNDWQSKTTAKDSNWTKMMTLLPVTQNINYTPHCNTCQKPLNKREPVLVQGKTLVSYQHEESDHKREILLEFLNNRLISKENIVTKFDKNNAENLQNYNITFEYTYQNNLLTKILVRYIIAERNAEGMGVSTFEEYIAIDYDDKNQRISLSYTSENQPQAVKYTLHYGK
ncbi:MAG: hypothetical protein ACKVTZ_10910 [Bacteroidia bacterium]